MKYIKKLSIGLVIAVLSSGIFIGLVPSKAYAAPDPISMKDQYVIYKSADLLKKCIFIANEYKTTNAQDVINSIFRTDGGADAGIGKLYGKFLRNTDIGNFECNTPKTINAALGVLGYDDIYNFAAAMGFPNNKLTKKDLDTKIDKRVQDKGVPNDLYGTRRFRYWYYNTVFRAALADGGCKGTFGDEPSANAKTNIGPSSFWNVGTNGVPKEYKYARYDVETGGNLPDLDDEVLKNTGLGTNEITCIKIAREITKERAEAYAAFLDTPEGGAEKPANTAGTSGTGSDSTGSGGAADDELSVQCSLNIFNPISYFMCPLIAGFIQAMNELDKAITDQLSLDTNNFIQGDQGVSFKLVWTNMRNLAISFIVIVGLLMVIGTAIEVGPFDPYTVKKVMPRLLVAVIVISLSWPLVIFLIDASNSLGFTVKGLIQGPFLPLLDEPIKVSGGQQWIAAAGFAGAGLTLGIVGLLSFVATAFMGVALAFLVLVLRQILVILLAIIAPVAIAMYILPNTQKAGKAWWDLFARSLLVFPIIAAFIATGRVFAAITVANSGGSPGTIEGFIAFFAYYGPYFALPFAFRLAGGAVGQIGGFVNDKSRGGFDRLKKFRQGQTQKNIEGIKSDNRFKGTNRLSRGASNALFMGSQASSVGVAGLVNPKLARDRMRASTSEKRMELYNKARENANVRSILANDDFAQAAVSGDGSEAAIKTHLATRGYNDVDANQAAQQIMRARREVGVEAFNDSALVATAGSGTGFKGGSGEMLSQIGLMSKGDSQRESFLYNESRKAAEAAGRTDLMGYSFGEGMDAINQLKKPGADVNAITEGLNDRVIESKGAGALATSKSQSVKNLSGAVQRRLDNARNEMVAAPGDVDKETAYKQALASTANMLDASSSASPENANVLAGILQQDSGAVKKNKQGQVIKRLTLGEHIEDMRSDPTFATYRREYGSAQAQAQAGSQTPQTPTTPVI